MKTVIGIDPGKRGGLAIYSAGMALATPLVYNQHGMVDVMFINAALMDAQPDIVVIERQWAHGGQGVTSSATTMLNYGRLLAVAELEGECMILTPTPQSWQKVILGSVPKGQTKDASIAWCRENFPDVSLLPTQRSRKPSDGLADALCLAFAGYSHSETLRKGMKR